MNLTLGCRAVALLAFVAISTAVIVEPEIIGGLAAADLDSMESVVVLGHP
jgi:hypothetical protein